MYKSLADERLAKELHGLIENEINSIGLLSRVFSRVKTAESIEKKYDNNPGKYSRDGKKIQDLFGARVVLYFPDDNLTAQTAIKSIFEHDKNSSSIDTPSNNHFSAQRCNLVFRLPSEKIKESELLQKYDYIDSSFEVQFRTMLSEGWHEIDHDLRYKHKEDWSTHNDLSRTLNGIYASLETADWSTLKLFEELAYRHYKSNEWTQMIRTKFRLRAGGKLNSSSQKILDDNPKLAKEIYRIERSELIKKITLLRKKPPININNIFYLSNFFFIKNDNISNSTPEPLKALFSDIK
ncbi:RelA/SpoT family protein [Cellvibrio sp. KY-GH-1]|uniref:RelA/SpoT domain-containing protein n=1 Tax=Cellvibrio sp. KY-GH-1 TaxID=2303332 RepID=UPI001244D886|nr:RelA/SpoT domain-containing protein [Cellvibrio sp. KY-GH-1]QEY15881.1 RelA/SpoT family protein [Cellvibrio sp. KY-GH-1]